LAANVVEHAVDDILAGKIAVLGNYMAGSFLTTAGGHGGALVSGTQIEQQLLLTHPPHG
jgi:hypothetical protein